MGQRQDINEYFFGETVGIGVYLRDRDGNALDPDDTTVTFIVSDPKTGTKLLVVPDATVLTVDAPTGEVTIPIPPAQQRNLVPNTVYRYDLWAVVASDTMHQAHGQFLLQPAVQP